MDSQVLGPTFGFISHYAIDLHEDFQQRNSEWIKELLPMAFSFHKLTVQILFS